MSEIILIAHDIRSCHNVGSLLRTAEGLGVNKVHLTGYTPYPKMVDDIRLPHLADKLNKQISKTALGAENLIDWAYSENIQELLSGLKNEGYTLVGLEQTKQSIKLPDYKAPQKMALLLGREVEGIDISLQMLCDEFIEIPMKGQKESFNVVQAAAIALYHCALA